MTTTTYLELEDQATGANNNTWGDVADANMAILEQAIARYVAIATTGGTTTLTSSQNRYPIIRLTGVLSSNATIEVKTQEKNWIFINATTGSYTVTVKTSAGTGKTLPRGRAVKLYCDGTNVEYARDRGIPAAQAGGTVDAITATFEPVTTSAELQDGTLWIVEAAGANTTTTPTFNPDSTGALTIKKHGGQALLAGDIRAAGHKLLLCYDSSGGHVELLNPYSIASTTDVLTGTDTSRAVTSDALAALWEKGTDVASAGTTSLGEGGYFNITGTTTITDIDFATDKAGRRAWLKFAGALTLTHSATLILPTSANITTAAGDTACFVSEGSDIVRCVSYNRASGAALGSSAASATFYTSPASGNYTIPANTTFVLARLWGAGGSGSTASALVSAGGGGGAYKEYLYRVSDLGGSGASVAYTVGAGGAASTGTSGNAGQDTSFGSLVAYGGGGASGTGTPGAGGGYFAAGGHGGTSTNGEKATSDRGGGHGGTGNSVGGGSAYYGGGGGGGRGNASATNGGSSYHGGAGGNCTAGAAGNAGSAPGGGGSGAGSNAAASGAGGAGRIEVYAW